MKVSERMVLKQTLKRLGLFCLIVLIPICFIGFGLMYAGLEIGWNITILVCVLFLFFGLFMMACSALDKRKEKKLKESGKKDPFSD